jgi:catechol 2,3-dioxygenase-like lactoylglutathione lyase family enzyme
MIGYATLGTNDPEKAVAFYDGLFSDLGVTKMAPNDRITLWTDASGKGMVAVISPFNGEAASPGNGNMLAISVDSVDTIKKLYNKALELGATDEGEPGERMPGMNFAYIRDPEGHKIAFFCQG